jgi:hypothetical protein
MQIRTMMTRSRPLTLWEKFLTALSVALAVATMALAAATAARAGQAGALPAEGPFYSGPATAISHAEGHPVGTEPVR